MSAQLHSEQQSFVKEMNNIIHGLARSADAYYKLLKDPNQAAVREYFLKERAASLTAELKSLESRKKITCLKALAELQATGSTTAVDEPDFDNNIKYADVISDLEHKQCHLMYIRDKVI